MSGQIRKRRSLCIDKFLQPPKGVPVDHKDGNGLNNCIENVRLCTTAQNQWNRGKSRTSSSGYKGVTWDRRKRRWLARIRRTRVRYNSIRDQIGLFTSR